MFIVDLALIKTCIHYFLHFVAPFFIALAFYRKNWRHAYLILLATMLVDADHLLADPIFDPNRKSIGYHPLHSYYAIAVYFLMLFWKGKVRLVAIGLLFHMLTDYQDYEFWH